jgi:hypothetical protein
MEGLDNPLRRQFDLRFGFLSIHLGLDPKRLIRVEASIRPCLRQIESIERFCENETMRSSFNWIADPPNHRRRSLGAVSATNP